DGVPLTGEVGEVRVPPDLPERDDDLHPCQRRDLRDHVAPAADDLVGQRLVVGRRAADRRQDVRVIKPQAIVPAARGRDVGQADAVERAHQEVARAVAGERAPGDGSGDFLMSALHRVGFADIPASRSWDDGLRLDDAYILAAVRCAPPDNKPLPDEIVRCRRHMVAEIAALARVQVIVALGKIGWDAYLAYLAGQGHAI